MGFTMMIFSEDDIDKFPNGLMWWHDVLNVHYLFLLYFHNAEAVFFKLWNIN